MKKLPLILVLVSLAGIIPVEIFAQQSALADTQNYVAIQDGWWDSNLPALAKCQPPVGTWNYAEVPEKISVPGGQEHLPLIRIAKGLGPFTTYTYYSCPEKDTEKILLENSSISSFERILLWTLSWILSLVDLLANFVLSLVGNMMLVMIGQGKFITNDIVKSAWPFVQGVANLGFIFALLYIALATTLRLESVSSSVQRLLPKLLIGALLVNFSLVIGGLVIDASRLFMAAEIQLMGNGTLDYKNFTAKLVEKSEILKTQIRSVDHVVKRDSSSAIALRLVQNTFFIVLLTLAMGVIAINLFIRYVALLILLILSPLAYLAIALPQTQGVVKQWWGMFLKWVLYGPIVLFFLIIITRIQDVGVSLPTPKSDTDTWTLFFNQFVHFAIVISLFFVANSVGKKVAGVGSDAVMGFAAKHPRTTAAAAGSLLTGGLGGAALGLAGLGVGKAVGRNAQDFYGDTKSNIAKRARGTELFGKNTMPSKIAKFIAGPERDKDGKTKAGEDSMGTWLADKLPVSTSTEGRAAIAAVSDAKVPDIKLWDPTVPGDDARFIREEGAAAAEIKKLQESKDLSAGKLIKKSTANALSKDQINMIMKHGTDDQREALATHKEVVKKMGDDVKGHITSGLIGSTVESKKDLKRKVDSRLRDLANKE